MSTCRTCQVALAIEPMNCRAGTFLKYLGLVAGAGGDSETSVSVSSPIYGLPVRSLCKFGSLRFRETKRGNQGSARFPMTTNQLRGGSASRALLSHLPKNRWFAFRLQL